MASSVRAAEPGPAAEAAAPSSEAHLSASAHIASRPRDPPVGPAPLCATPLSTREARAPARRIRAQPEEPQHRGGAGPGASHGAGAPRPSRGRLPRGRPGGRPRTPGPAERPPEQLRGAAPGRRGRRAAPRGSGEAGGRSAEAAGRRRGRARPRGTPGETRRGEGPPLGPYLGCRRAARRGERSRGPPAAAAPRTWTSAPGRRRAAPRSCAAGPAAPCGRGGISAGPGGSFAPAPPWPRTAAHLNTSGSSPLPAA